MPLVSKCKAILLLPLLFILLSCISGQKDTVKIEGHFSNSANVKLLLFELLPDSSYIADSTSTDKEGNFKFSISPKEAGFYLIRRDARNSITLVVKKGGKIKLDGDGRSLTQTYSVEGSEESVLLREFDQFTAINQTTLDSLKSVFMYSQSLEDFPLIRQELDAEYITTFNKEHDQTVSFLRKNPSSLASVLIANRSFGRKQIISMDVDYHLCRSIDSSIMLKYPGNSHARAYHERVSDCKVQLGASEINKEGNQAGTVAPDFELPDASGKLIKFSSLKRQMTLVFFWASWNGPCRKMNMDLAAIYEEFHPREFEIVGISLDPIKNDWIQAIKIDKANWIQFQDKSGLNSVVARSYNIHNLPAAILVGKDRKIISGKLNTNELKSLLKVRL